MTLDEAMARVAALLSDPHPGLASWNQALVRATDACPQGYGTVFNAASFRGGFAWLWNEINGTRAPWVSNPYVWAITFKRVRP